jgi:hypothetical protein
MHISNILTLRVCVAKYISTVTNKTRKRKIIGAITHPSPSLLYPTRTRSRVCKIFNGTSAVINTATWVHILVTSAPLVTTARIVTSAHIGVATATFDASDKRGDASLIAVCRYVPFAATSTDTFDMILLGLAILVVVTSAFDALNRILVLYHPVPPDLAIQSCAKRHIWLNDNVAHHAPFGFRMPIKFCATKDTPLVLRVGNKTRAQPAQDVGLNLGQACPL